MGSRHAPRARAEATRRIGLILSLCLWSTAGIAQPALPGEASAVLERFAGNWDVTLTVRRPKPAVVNYTQHSTWILNRRYVRGESSTRPDGSQDLTIFAYESQSRTYPVWIFFSSGFVAYLQRGEWNATTQTMSWKSAAADPIQFTSRCTFESATTYRCSTQVKDGKGGLAIDQEVVAQRRRS